MSDEKDELRLLKAFATELVMKKTMAAQKKSEPTVNLASEMRFKCMTRYIYLLSAVALFVACEQKQTTVNPPAEKKESTTTIVKPPAEKKETQTTVINPPATTETKKEKTEVNIGTSPRP
jgi:hypothetical protein